MSSPSLVGGIALRAYDLPGSIVFDVAYGLLLPVLIARLVARRSRTAALFQVLAFAIERVVLFSLRAAVAARPHTETPGLSDYMQVTFSQGFLTLAHTISSLVRTVLVNSTQSAPPSECDADAEAGAPSLKFQPPLVSDASPSASLWKLSLSPPPASAVADDPRRRFWFRRWSEYTIVLYLAALVTAVVSTSHPYAPNDTAANRRNQALRLASASIGLVLLLSVGSMLLWARRNVPQINQGAVRFLLTATMLLTVPTIYRLAVMEHTTPDIAAVDAQALNTLAHKATFYIFHILPEWIVAAMMAAFNVKEICGIGFRFDERWWDETPKERAKRERKKREREMKKAETKNAEFELKSTSQNSTETSTLA
ncbi:hypothetical protein DFH09DRAFT_301077 [Mycena vulgaris]|nr:hypothetical protein DFH09DRAFT_301077 [Mycena vulgaris]